MAKGDKVQIKHRKSTSEAFICETILPQHGLTDGHVWISDGRLYLFGGHDSSWHTTDTWRMDRWEIWSTDDLLSWDYEGKILPTETYIGDRPNCWAGDITERNGKFYWYFSNRNEDTGVMVSDKITGGFVDPLGKPLLPKDIIKGHPYDPEIVIEDGRYYIIFSAGHYKIAELGDDMISLKGEIRDIVVLDEEGKPKWTADKSSHMKREGIHYLIWGSHYATSDKLEGPYTYRGAFLNGGHTSMFEWHGQWYVIQENKDISLFFRGLSLKPIFFNADGTIQVPVDDMDYPGGKRKYRFEVNQMGWHYSRGEDVERIAKGQNRSIGGELYDGCSIESSCWLLDPVENLSQIKITIKNHSNAQQAKVEILTASTAKYNGKSFWSDSNMDWPSAYGATFELESARSGFVEYTIPLKGKLTNEILKAIRVTPAIGKSEGRWEIKSIEIE